MHGRGIRPIILLHVFLVASGCRPGGGGETVVPPDAAAPDGVPPDAAADAGKICFADNMKLEADRRSVEVKLEPVMARLRQIQILMETIDEVAAAALAGKAFTLKPVLENAWERLEPVRAGFAQDELSHMSNIINSRAQAYLTCKAVAERNADICDLAKDATEGQKDGCHATYAVYALIAERAVKKGEPCAEALKDPKVRLPEGTVKVCEAIVQQKPELCPWKEDAASQAYCRAAATRSPSAACAPGAWTPKPRDLACCGKFKWRFASVLNPASISYNIPEIGALSGETEGCLNALRWGLFEDLAPVFKVEDLPDTGPTHGEYLCPLEIFWSANEPLEP
jgi:hypothetical protein